jgi:hypothetical protein
MPTRPNDATAPPHIPERTDSQPEAGHTQHNPFRFVEPVPTFPSLNSATLLRAGMFRGYENLWRRQFLRNPMMGRLLSLALNQASPLRRH